MYALLLVASVWMVVGIPAVKTGFAPAVPDDPVLETLLVASQADKPPVLRALPVPPASGLMLAVSTASISRRNSFPFFTVWYAISELRPARSWNSKLSAMMKVLREICVRLFTRTVGLTAVKDETSSPSIWALDELAAASVSVCHSNKVLDTDSCPMLLMSGVCSGLIS